MALLTGCGPGPRENVDRLGRSYARVSLQYDRDALGANERAVLEKLWLAARPIEKIFWTQVLPDAQRLRGQLEGSSLPEDKKRLEYFLINYGPYDRLRNDRNFVGAGERPAGAGFYPDGLTSLEFESFLVRHPALRRQLESPTTLIRRTSTGFEAIPYEQTYAAELSESASFLNQAALVSDRPRLARYLQERARALVQGDYRDSDRLWVSLRDEPLDIVIGPIEVSEDQLLGIKGAYEAAVLVRDKASSGDLEKFGRWAERFLPAEGFHQTAGETESTETWQVVLFSGQLDAGVKTVALTLPNDDEIKRGGTRKLIFSNVLRAKFENVLRPLSQRLFDPEDSRRVTEDALLWHVLLHESCHLFQAGEDRRPLADTAPILDELKADILALYVASKAAGQGWMLENEWRCLQTSYVAGVLRAVRMGVGSPHAQANAIQLDALLAGKALRAEKSVFRLQLDRLQPSLQPLVSAIREIERRADYASAKKLIEEKSRVPVNIQRRLIALDSVPVDVAFDYQKP